MKLNKTQEFVPTEIFLIENQLIELPNYFHVALKAIKLIKGYEKIIKKNISIISKISSDKILFYPAVHYFRKIMI